MHLGTPFSTSFAVGRNSPSTASSSHRSLLAFFKIPLPRWRIRCNTFAYVSEPLLERAGEDRSRSAAVASASEGVGLAFAFAFAFAFGAALAFCEMVFCLGLFSGTAAAAGASADVRTTVDGDPGRAPVVQSTCTPPGDRVAVSRSCWESDTCVGSESSGPKSLSCWPSPSKASSQDVVPVDHDPTHQQRLIEQRKRSEVLSVNNKIDCTLLLGDLSSKIGIENVGLGPVRLVRHIVDKRVISAGTARPLPLLLRRRQSGRRSRFGELFTCISQSILMLEHAVT